MARALTVLQVLPALDAGGVELSTLEIAEALVRAGHRALVVSAGGRLLPRLEACGATHIALDIGRKSPWTLRHVAPLRRLIERQAPDIVHARSRLPAWMALFALRGLRGPRFVTTAHGLNRPGRYSAVMTRGERVICVSATVRAHLLRHYPRLDPARLVVIERGIDPDRFPHGHRAPDAWRAAFLAEHPPLAGGMLLTLPGRGTRLKGHAAAIDLLAALRTRGLDARLLLLGAAEAGRERYLDEMRARARAAGIDGALAFSAPRSDVREVYAISDLVLQLSNRPEAFGRTVLEALALGRPVLGWAHGGVGEQLARWFPGGAVAPGDVAALVDVAEALLRAPPVLAPIAAPTTAAMQQATLALYRQLAGDEND